VVIAAAAISGYLWLIGARPALLRAALMCVLGTLVYLRRGRRPDMRALLVLSFLLQSLIDPRSAASLSFMLSYLALAGILTLARPMAELLPCCVPPALRNALGVGLAAQLATAPLCAVVFGRLYPAGALATLLLAPVVTGLLYLSLLFIVYGGAAGWIAPALLWQGEAVVRALILFFYRLARGAAGAAASLPPLRISAGSGGTVSLAVLLVLTGLLLSPYAGAIVRWGRSVGRRGNEAAGGLQLAQGDRPFSGATGHRGNPPLWAELSGQPGGPGEDRHAA
jgi:competence protein ComEC